MTRTAPWVLALVCVSGCHAQDEPHVSGVVPNVVQAVALPQVQVRGRHLSPAWSSLGDRTVEVRVWVGGQHAEVTALEEDGTRVGVRLPVGLEPGLHAVRVQTAGGEDTLENALRVEP